MFIYNSPCLVITQHFHSEFHSAHLEQFPWCYSVVYKTTIKQLFLSYYQHHYDLQTLQDCGEIAFLHDKFITLYLTLLGHTHIHTHIHTHTYTQHTIQIHTTHPTHNTLTHTIHTQTHTPHSYCPSTTYFFHQILD